MGWPKTGANNGQNDPKLTPSRWFDIGNARINAEERNNRHADNKAWKKEQKKANKKKWWQ